MSELNIEILKEIVEKLPDDFLVEFKDNEGSTFTLSDNINESPLNHLGYSRR